MNREAGLRSVLTSLWFRLTALAIAALVFAEALVLAPGKAQGWTFYLTAPEVVFEVAMRIVVAALTGLVLGTLLAAAVTPVLSCFRSSRESLAGRVVKVFVLLVVFLDSRFALIVLIRWSHHGARFVPALLATHFLVFAIALCIPRGRRELVTSLDGFLGEKMTRRTVIATGVGTAALVATEFAIGRTVPPVQAAAAPSRPKSNILLITFDALSAEDMSLYGFGLPTTPNIDAFARKGTTFTNFFSGSTFTTASVATMLTGMYPSESHVYQLQGRVRPDNAGKTLHVAMRTGGYATGAFLSNPFAYYFAEHPGTGYDALPAPAFQPGGLEHLWNATKPLHQNSGFGSRIDEYLDFENVWNALGGMPTNISMRLRPDATFGQAAEALAKLPDGYFFWVHVVTPHTPYLPDPADRGRFLPADKLTTWEEESGMRWQPHYEPDQQSQVSQRRLRYDEFIATADRAFGSFLSELESRGRLRNTTVIVSADHGESFEGGVYQHSSAYLTRPVIHIPLIVRTPGQEDSRRIAVTADQTALAPTILELAGLPKPDSMRGQSLVSWLSRDGQGAGEGLAFCQYLEKNSVYAPLRHGTVGVIDGQYQYVLDLATQKGALRPLNEAQIWNLDRSAENPALAAKLHAAIYSRFPDLPRKSP